MQTCCTAGGRNARTGGRALAHTQATSGDFESFNLVSDSSMLNALRLKLVVSREHY